MFSPSHHLSGTSMYEVNMRQYTASGTFQAFSLHLPRLKDMGIDILWFMPLTPISIKERKGTLGSYYAASDYTTINPEYGTSDDFKKLVSKAHDLGFKVMIDWVANHTGWDHTWTHRYPDYYLKNDQGMFFEKNGWEDVIDLDYNNAEMRQSMIECMGFWIHEYNIDGFRCDMAMLVPIDFWLEARTTLDQVKPLIWLGECEDPHYFEAFDMLYAWEWMHLTKAVAHSNANKHDLADIMYKYLSCKNRNQRHLYFTSNHDENSWNGTEYERYGHAALLYAALTTLLPDSIPLIYSGQELPVQHRLKFFDKDEIIWTMAQPQLHSFYQALIQLRHRSKWYQAIDTPPSSINSLTHDDAIFTLHIGYGGDGDIFAIFNLRPDHITFHLHVESLIGKYRNIYTGSIIEPEVERDVILNGFEFRVFQNLIQNT